MLGDGKGLAIECFLRLYNDTLLDGMAWHGDCVFEELPFSPALLA